MLVDHIDGDKANNNPRNLRWATFRMNAGNRGQNPVLLDMDEDNVVVAGDLREAAA
jgi:hypothetical protein